MKLNPYEAPELPDMIARLQAQAKDKHIFKEKILKDIRNVRRQLYSESFGPKNVIELANLRIKEEHVDKSTAIR